ncbi:MAG TPA: TIGR00730 family Rossman fold protein [Gemmatales bacterium]|nr:TIGR00730 family Rossman fold protein [Gemmatales bacterium]
MKIALYCGARKGNDPIYVELAHSVARTLAQRGIGIVYGGGNIGLMGVIAEAAIQAGGEIIGVIPGSMVEEELAHHGITRLEIVNTMHQRKARIEELSDAFIALPGGYGTLDELFEIITWRQLKLHHKPIGLLNHQGFYDSLVAFVDHACKEGFVPGKNRELLIVANDLETLLGKIIG